MLHDLRRSITTFQQSTLRTLESIGARLLIGALGQCHALHADGEPCVVHHGEHAGYALVLFADQVADRAARIAVGHTSRPASPPAPAPTAGSARDRKSNRLN